MRYKLVQPLPTIIDSPPLTPQQAFTLSVNPACSDSSFFYDRIPRRRHNSPCLLFAFIRIRQGMDCTNYNSRSLLCLPLTTMTLLSPHVHPCFLQTVMILPSQLPTAKTPSFNLWMTAFYALQVKPLSLLIWNRSTTISSHNGIPVLSSSHQPTSTIPRHTYSTLSLFYVKLSTRVLWPTEQLNHGCSLS